jgi:5'-3' exonuclease
MFRGDPSDGLPGVRGIGEKGAALIANHFATVDEALAGAKKEHEALSKSLANGADYLKIAPTLVHCAKDVAIPQMDIAMPKKPKDLSPIYQMKEEYGLGASVDRLISALGW